MAHRVKIITPAELPGQVAGGVSGAHGLPRFADRTTESHEFGSQAFDSGPWTGIRAQKPDVVPVRSAGIIQGVASHEKKY